MGINQAKYSYGMKIAQLIAIGVGMGLIFLTVIKVYGHVELHMDRPFEQYYEDAHREDRDWAKEVDRQWYPDRTEQERRDVDKEIEQGKASFA